MWERGYRMVIYCCKARQHTHVVHDGGSAGYESYSRPAYASAGFYHVWCACFVRESPLPDSLIPSLRPSVRAALLCACVCCFCHLRQIDAGALEGMYAEDFAKASRGCVGHYCVCASVISNRSCGAVALAYDCLTHSVVSCVRE